MLALLSTFRALSRLDTLPSLSTNPALDATPSKVPVVSKRFTKRNDIITLIIAISKAPKISSFISVGASDGGYATTPWNSIKFNRRAAKVTPSTPIIIAPGTFLTARTEINKNPRADKKVS